MRSFKYQIDCSSADSGGRFGVDRAGEYLARYIAQSVVSQLASEHGPRFALFRAIALWIADDNAAFFVFMEPSEQPQDELVIFYFTRGFRAV
jgi:hypothetical protein